jgi:hypothetical protein
MWSGRYQATLGANGLVGCVCLARMTAGDYVETKNLFLIK